MDYVRIFLYMEQHCKNYRKQLPLPSHTWPDDICGGYLLMNKHLFNVESTIAFIKIQNRTPQKNFSGRFRIIRYPGKVLHLQLTKLSIKDTSIAL